MTAQNVTVVALPVEGAAHVADALALFAALVCVIPPQTPMAWLLLPGAKVPALVSVK